MVIMMIMSLTQPFTHTGPEPRNSQFCLYPENGVKPFGSGSVDKVQGGMQKRRMARRPGGQRRMDEKSEKP
jgi:hypothetical protein